MRIQRADTLDPCIPPRSKICLVCQTIFTETGQRYFGSQLKARHAHHESLEALVRCLKSTYCYFCSMIWQKLQTSAYGTKHNDETHAPYLSYTMSKLSLRSDSIADTSTCISSWNYILEVFLPSGFSGRVKRPIAVFNLFWKDNDKKQSDEVTEKKHEQALPNSAATRTNDPKAFAQAKRWIDTCRTTHHQCMSKSNDFFPTRVIQVEPNSNTLEGKGFVRIMKGIPAGHEDKSYITLSHRWGSAQFPRLTKNTYASFLDGVALATLPPTFRHAIEFTRSLGIKWLWIDALCIVQDDTDDWAREASLMGHVYTNSYCNLSATAALDSFDGLFFERDPISSGIQTVKVCIQTDLNDVQSVYCRVQDPGFWDRSIVGAPINRRSWVLQETILTSRVLHCTRDQIAFQCRAGSQLSEADPIEAGSEQLSDLLELRSTASHGTMLPKQWGPTILPIIRSLKGYFVAPENAADICARSWKVIVQNYSRMELSQPGDRLIALSGVASIMYQAMDIAGRPDSYIAGLWQSDLATQLIWYVNEASDEHCQAMEDNTPRSSDGCAVYRAPSFSWAAVETSRGITFISCGANTPLISILSVYLDCLPHNDAFGLINSGHVVIRCLIRSICLVDRHKRIQCRNLDIDTLTINRWAWQLLDKSELAGTEHTIIWLDSPAAQPTIFGRAANVFIIPILVDSASMNVLYCLIVQAVQDGQRFKRIGMTKVVDFDGELRTNVGIVLNDRSSDSEADNVWVREAGEKNIREICLI